MNKLKRLAKSLLRRWYVSVPAILLAGALCLYAYNKTTPMYERTASEILIPGKASVPVGGNPYYYLGGLSQASDVLVRSLNSTAVMGPILDGFPNTTAVVARDVSTSGPMLTVTVDGPSDEAVASVLQEVIDSIPTTLGGLQDEANVPSESRIGTLTLTQDATSKLIQKSRYETIGVIAVGSLVGIVLLVGLLDGLLLTLQRRRAEKNAVAASMASANPVPPAESLRTGRKFSPFTSPGKVEDGPK